MHTTVIEFEFKDKTHEARIHHHGCRTGMGLVVLPKEVFEDVIKSEYDEILEDVYGDRYQIRMPCEALTALGRVLFGDTVSANLVDLLQSVDLTEPRKPKWTDRDEMLTAHGWVVECEGPFEIRHEDGSFATGQAADMVVACLTYDEGDE